MRNSAMAGTIPGRLLRIDALRAQRSAAAHCIRAAERLCRIPCHLHQTSATLAASAAPARPQYVRNGASAVKEIPILRSPMVKRMPPLAVRRIAGKPLFAMGPLWPRFVVAVLYRPFVCAVFEKCLQIMNPCAAKAALPDPEERPACRKSHTRRHARRTRAIFARKWAAFCTICGGSFRKNTGKLRQETRYRRVLRFRRRPRRLAGRRIPVPTGCCTVGTIQPSGYWQSQQAAGVMKVTAGCKRS